MRNRTLAARNIGFVPVPLAKRFRQAHSTKKSHGGAPSKHSNSSRIRAQVMRNSTLAARNIGFVPVPLAKRFRQAHSTKKSHGGAPSKHSNSSRIRAQVMRNSSQKKCLTLPTERSKKATVDRPNTMFHGLAPSKHSNSSKIRARVAIVKSPTVRPHSSATTS